MPTERVFRTTVVAKLIEKIRGGGWLVDLRMGSGWEGGISTHRVFQFIAVIAVGCLIRFKVHCKTLCDVIT